MSLTNRSPTSQIEESSHDLNAALKMRLKNLSERDADHARFLNTLSLMEHLGSRKIMTSRAARKSTRNANSELLKHLAEESRHAFFFKRAAERIADTELGYGPEDTFAAPSARMYMERLDAYISSALGDTSSPQLPYLYMSLIVELRAVWFYRAYQDVLSENGRKLSLKGVLAEEEVHLAEMLQNLEKLDPHLAENLDHFCAFENTRFRALWSGIEAEMT